MDSVVNWGVVDSVNWGDGVMGDNGGLGYWDWSVGSNGGLDLSQTLGVVSLGDGGVGGSEGLALAESSDLTVSRGDRLVRVLAGPDSQVVRGQMVSDQDRSGGGGPGIGQ